VTEVRWLSTWGRHANRELRQLLGLPELAVAGERPVEGAAVPAAEGLDAPSHGRAVADRSRWWKLAAAAAVVAG
jgi:hypothetical protein